MWITITKTVVSCGILIVESILDIKTRKVHILSALMMAIIGVVALFLQHRFSLFSFCLSECVGIFLYMVSILTEEKLGKGDAFYVMALGTILDVREMMVVSMISFFLTALVGIGFFAVKKVDRRYRLPYLPFLTGAYMAVLINNWCMV